MHRQALLDDLALYQARWLGLTASHRSHDPDEETRIIAVFDDFIRATPGCFERQTTHGHVTGSALVVSPDLDQVLLTLHGKLNLWLQLGGHADGDPYPHQVALREAEEESGLGALQFLSHALIDGPAGRPLPFDLDCHAISARPGEPSHYHYDVRYLVLADPRAPLTITNESRDLRWLTLSEARRLTNERSMHRQFDKLEWLRHPQDAADGAAADGLLFRSHL